MCNGLILSFIQFAVRVWFFPQKIMWSFGLFWKYTCACAHLHVLMIRDITLKTYCSIPVDIIIISVPSYDKETLASCSHLDELCLLWSSCFEIISCVFLSQTYQNYQGNITCAMTLSDNIINITLWAWWLVCTIQKRQQRLPCWEGTTAWT